MKKILLCITFILAGALSYATYSIKDVSDSEQKSKSGEVVVMNKKMFINDVFDYENTPEWKYKGDKPAIIDMYADWCGPCRAVAPIMKELAKEYEGKVAIGKLNVDDNDESPELYGIRNIPTVLFFKNGELVDKLVGVAQKAAFVEKIEAIL